MGRYTQRRRAASGPSPAAAPTPLTIVSVVVGPFASALVTFSGVVALDLGAFPDAAFSGPAGGGAPTVIFAAGPDEAQVNFGGSVVVGDPWALTAQPNWCISPLAFPDSGVVA